jgi:GT2 family glycosyltransferase
VTPSVGVAIVVFRQSDDEVANLLAQLDALSWAGLRRYVVCNEPGRDLSKVIGDAVMIETGANLGFCGGANAAARAATADGCSHLLLCNTDVHLLVDDLVERLLAPFNLRADCAFASPGIVLWPDVFRVFYRGGEILRPLWLTRYPGIGRPWARPSRGIVPTECFSGCSALVDLDAFGRLGGFDETLFMYYDEADLSFRARTLGLRAYLVDEPLVAHAKPRRRLGEIESFFFARNAGVLLRRNERGWRRVLGSVGQVVLAPTYLARCDSTAARRAYLAGARAGGTGMPDVLTTGVTPAVREETAPPA